MTKLIYPNCKKLNNELRSIKNVNNHRKIDCIHYDICLNKASILNYESFSCIDCNMYIQIKIENEEKKFKKIIKEIIGENNGPKESN
jgi:hypothetical protein